MRLFWNVLLLYNNSHSHISFFLQRPEKYSDFGVSYDKEESPLDFYCLLILHLVYVLFLAKWSNTKVELPKALQVRVDKCHKLIPLAITAKSIFIFFSFYFHLFFSSREDSPKEMHRIYK